MLTHWQIWTAVEALAQKSSLTPSGMAKAAGLDPTTFNKSKRTTASGKPRWPSTESIAKILEATHSSFEDFSQLVMSAGGKLSERRAPIPLIGFAQAGVGGFFDDGGFHVGGSWDLVKFPELHDENAYALGGYSGHAGLFGIAEEIYAIANILREHYYGKREDFFKPETVRTFFVRQSLVCNSTWALGWDTPSSDNSSAGNYFSQNSVGHLGFTGTSIWIDLDKDVVVIFLTNRIHPTRNNKKIKEMRPRLHNLIMEELGFG